MIIIFGLIILVAAVIAGVAGVLGNAGATHALAHPFSVLGYHLTGSTGTLFLYGMVVGAVGLLGFTLLLGGARRTSRRGREARLGLRQSRRETAAVSRDRDDLLDQREAARADIAPATADIAPATADIAPATADIAPATGDGARNASPRPGRDSGRSWQQRLLRPPPAVLATGDGARNASPRPGQASGRSWQQRLLRPPPFAPSPEAASAPAATLPVQTAVITETSADDVHAAAVAD